MNINNASGLEGWLSKHADSWSIVEKSEAVAIRANYRHLLKSQNSKTEKPKPFAKNELAYSELEKRVPFSGFLFATSGRPEVYQVTNLRAFDFDLFNSLDLFIGDAEMRYACIFSHEAGYWEDIAFYEGEPQ